MSEKKTIHINPDLFSFSKNTTKKKKTPNENISSPIKIKTNMHHTPTPRTLRKSVLKMIRENQEKSLKNIYSEKNNQPKLSPTDDFDNDFNQSLNFFSKLTQKKEEELKQANPNIHNSTLKKYPNPQPNSILLQPNQSVPLNENVQLEFPTEFSLPLQQSIYKEPPMPIARPLVPPSYGCLKNGSLPTYRNWKHQTQRVYPPIQNQPNTNLYDNPEPFISSNEMPSEKVRAIGIMKTIAKAEEQLAPKKNNIRYLKRRKIYKRTYRVGRSKTVPKIGVLISNRTLRNRTTEQTHLLKQIPIQEVRKYLIKKGFIKIGTTAPNDVLRKMYESVLLICGDVQNHNPDNLLYNFINDNTPT
jgi:hypothetical protein